MLPAIGASFAFALTANLAPYAYGAGASVMLFLAVRFVLSYAIASAATRRVGLPAGTRRDLPWLGAMSLFMGSQSMLYYLAIYHLPVSSAVCLFFLFPVFTYALETILGRHSWSVAMVAGFSMALLGTWALVSGGEEREATALGGAAGVGGAISQALVNLASVRARSVGRLELLRVGFVIPLLLAVVLWAVLDGELEVPPAGWSALAALTYLLGMFLYISSLRKHGAVRASTYMYIEPVITICMGMLLHAESLSVRQLAGMALIAAAIALVEFKSRRDLVRAVQSMHA